MVKKGIKKILAIFLVLILFAVIPTACNTTFENQGKASGEAVSASSLPVAVDGPVEIELFVNFPWWTLREWSGFIPEEITKRTGVKFAITIAADDRKLPMLIASDNLPELVFTDQELMRLANDKMCYDWNSLVEKYAPDFTIDKKISSLYTQTNGKFYTVLGGYSSQKELEENAWVLPNGPGLAVRKDIMQMLGYPPLETLKDFEKILETVKVRWPDMIPLVSEEVKTFGYLNAQFGQVGSAIEFYPTENGEVSYYIKQPGKLDFYKYVNKLYREGYIHATNFSFSEGSSDARRLARDGKAFAIIGTVEMADCLNADLVKMNKNFQMMMASSTLSQNTRYYNGSVGGAGVFITQRNKHLKESINFMKFMFSAEGQKLGLWGIEGRDWRMNPKGYPEFTYPTQDTNLLQEQGYYWWGKMSGSAVLEGLRNYAPALLATPVRKEIKKHSVYDQALGMLNPPAYSDEKIIQTKLKTMVTNEQYKIFLAKSEEEVIKAYDDMLKKAADIGVQKYEFWANKQYQQAVSKF